MSSNCIARFLSFLKYNLVTVLELNIIAQVIVRRTFPSETVSRRSDNDKTLERLRYVGREKFKLVVVQTWREESRKPPTVDM